MRRLLLNLIRRRKIIVNDSDFNTFGLFIGLFILDLLADTTIE